MKKLISVIAAITTLVAGHTTAFAATAHKHTVTHKPTHKVVRHVTTKKPAKKTTLHLVKKPVQNPSQVHTMTQKTTTTKTTSKTKSRPPVITTKHPKTDPKLPYLIVGEWDFDNDHYTLAEIVKRYQR